MGVLGADHLEEQKDLRRRKARLALGTLKPTSKQYFSPRMELWTGLMTVLESALRSRLPKALIGIETDSREPWCLEERQNGHFLAKIYSEVHKTKQRRTHTCCDQRLF